MSDAPERISIVDVHTVAKPIIADRRSGGHSRRSSTASWSSGQDLRVPDSDADDEDAGDPRKPPLKKVCNIYCRSQTSLSMFYRMASLQAAR